jgi:hypothetical protein
MKKIKLVLSEDIYMVATKQKFAKKTLILKMHTLSFKIIVTQIHTQSCRFISRHSNRYVFQASILKDRVDNPLHSSMTFSMKTSTANIPNQYSS